MSIRLRPYPRIAGGDRDLDGGLGRAAGCAGLTRLQERPAEVDPAQRRLADADAAGALLERLDRRVRAGRDPRADVTRPAGSTSPAVLKA